MHSAKEQAARVANMMTQLARSSELCSTQEGAAGDQKLTVIFSYTESLRAVSNM